LLLTGNCSSALKIGFCLCTILLRRLQRDFSSDAIDLGFDPSKESAPGIAALAQLAVTSGNFDAFRRCIRESAFDLNAGYSPHGWTLLHQLAELGKKTLPVHARMAEDLLNAGADLNCKTVWGWTPLHLIAMHGRVQAVELAKVLIAHRPDLTAVDDQGLGWKDHWQHGKEIYDLLEDASKRYKPRSANYQ
jgi:ankyrin repeat protein